MADEIGRRAPSRGHAMVVSPRVPLVLRLLERIASSARATVGAAPRRGDERQSRRARCKLVISCRAALPVALTSHRQPGRRSLDLDGSATAQASLGMSRLGAATLVEQCRPRRAAAGDYAMRPSWRSNHLDGLCLCRRGASCMCFEPQGRCCVDRYPSGRDWPRAFVLVAGAITYPH